MEARFLMFPAYVNLSRFTTEESPVPSHCRMKFEPMNPAPPVIKIEDMMISDQYSLRKLHASAVGGVESKFQIEHALVSLCGTSFFIFPIPLRRCRNKISQLVPICAI